MSNGAKTWILAVAGSALMASSHAVAQDRVNLAGAGPADMFARDRNVSVQSRPRPDFEALGVHAESFFFYPRLELGASFNDNIYAAETGEVDDVVFHIRPEAVLESDWNQHFVSVYARASFNRFQDFDTENTDEFAVGGSGRIDVWRFSTISFGADLIDSFEPRTAPNAPSATVEPVELDLAQAFLAGSHAVNRTRVSVRGDWRSFDYEDGRTAAGAVVDQDARDRDVVSASGRLDYAISPDTAIFGQVTGNSRTYDVDSTLLAPNRDSSGVEVLAGASFELGAVTRGEIAAGYIEQQYDELAYDDVSGFGARAQLEWFPSQLTTITFVAARTVEDSVYAGSGGYLSSTGSVTVDHELLRNLILTGQVTCSDDEYEGIDRQDQRFGASVGATYLVNRNFGVNLSASTLQSDSSGADRDDDFTVNKLMISLVGQL